VLLGLAGKVWELTGNFIFVDGFTSLTFDCKQKWRSIPFEELGAIAIGAGVSVDTRTVFPVLAASRRSKRIYVYEPLSCLHHRPCQCIGILMRILIEDVDLLVVL
jgi:hypothetical protein